MRFTVEMSAKPLGFLCSYDTTAQEITAVGRNIVITVAAITLSQIAVALVLRRAGPAAGASLPRSAPATAARDAGTDRSRCEPAAPGAPVGMRQHPLRFARARGAV